MITSAQDVKKGEELPTISIIYQGEKSPYPEAVIMSVEQYKYFQRHAAMREAIAVSDCIKEMPDVNPPKVVVEKKGGGFVTFLAGMGVGSLVTLITIVVAR